MMKSKQITKVKEKAGELLEKLNQIPVQPEDNLPSQKESVCETDKTEGHIVNSQTQIQPNADDEYERKLKEAHSKIFDRWDETEFLPQDFATEVAVNSLESSVGYTSLIRQLHHSYLRTVAFYLSPGGGSLSPEEAQKQAFHVCSNKEEAKRIFTDVLGYSTDNIGFEHLHSLYSFAPRVAERLWEKIKREGRAEFESGHLAANTMLPVGYMRDAWTVARYLGVRESFVDEWKPKGGIEISLIDMLAQAFFQWQFWLEQSIVRSQTRERTEHPEYQEWQRLRKQLHKESWADGIWLRPYVTEQSAIEHAVQMADRWNRIYMRTLRQLRDLRRYSPATINNPNQVNIATNGGQQVNVSNTEVKEEEKTKKISS